MLKEESRVIDGTTYTLVQMQAIPCLKLLPRLMGALGPAVSKLNVKSRTLMEDLELSIIGDAIAALTDKLTPAEFIDITKELLYSLTIDGKPAPVANDSTFQLLMAGKMFTVLKLIKFALELNYGDFFGAAGKLAVVKQFPAASSSKA